MTGLEFLKTALRDYRIGAITKSSPQTIARVVEAIPQSCAYLVEYGPGDGTVTRAILKRLPSHGRVVAIEQNVTLVHALQSLRDPRLSVVHGDILDIAPRLRELSLPRIDAVVSCVPCTLLKPHEREHLVRETHRALAPGGAFVMYQYSPLMAPLLRKYFGGVRFTFAPLNLPPYFVMTATKMA
jgi:phospholipid N-methyltransferase